VVDALPPPRPPRSDCAWPEARTGGGVPVDPIIGAGLARDADVLAGHGGVTAGRRRPDRGDVGPCRGTVKLPDVVDD
jgi:hypothetical protein